MYSGETIEQFTVQQAITKLNRNLTRSNLAAIQAKLSSLNVDIFNNLAIQFLVTRQLDYCLNNLYLLPDSEQILFTDFCQELFVETLENSDHLTDNLYLNEDFLLAKSR